MGALPGETHHHHHDDVGDDDVDDDDVDDDDVDDDGDGDRLGGKWVGQSHNGGEWEGICSGRGRGVSSQVRSGLRNTKYRLPALPTNEWGLSKATNDEATRKFPIFEGGGNAKKMRNGGKHVQLQPISPSLSVSDSLGGCGVEVGLVEGASRGVARKLFLFS